jgi:hypothetical protein
MKTEFFISTHKTEHRGGSKVRIIGRKPESIPYLSFKIGADDPFGFIDGKELRQLAKNILKAFEVKQPKKKK